MPGTHDTLGFDAVLIFFATSGLLITRSWIREPRARLFAARRGLRILPGARGVVLRDRLPPRPVDHDAAGVGVPSQSGDDQVRREQLALQERLRAARGLRRESDGDRQRVARNTSDGGLRLRARARHRNAVARVEAPASSARLPPPRCADPDCRIHDRRQASADGDRAVRDIRRRCTARSSRPASSHPRRRRGRGVRHVDRLVPRPLGDPRAASRRASPCRISRPTWVGAY